MKPEVGASKVRSLAEAYLRMYLEDLTRLGANPCDDIVIVSDQGWTVALTTTLKPESDEQGPQLRATDRLCLASMVRLRERISADTIRRHLKRRNINFSLSTVKRALVRLKRLGLVSCGPRGHVLKNDHPLFKEMSQTLN